MNAEAPNPQLPIVQKVRVRYAKRGRLRFLSVRDIGRAVERAIRRADLPIGHSEGFRPHPKISYANAVPTGAASEAEFLELGFTVELDPADVRERLDAALPPGLDVIDVVAAGPGNLADRLEASEWLIELPEADESELELAVKAFLAAEQVTIERMTKRGLREVDVRAAVVRLRAEGTSVITVTRATIPTTRPDDIVAGLREHGLGSTGTPVAVRRLQGPLSGTDVLDPLAADRV